MYIWMIKIKIKHYVHCLKNNKCVYFSFKVSLTWKMPLYSSVVFRHFFAEGLTYSHSLLFGHIIIWRWVKNCRPEWKVHEKRNRVSSFSWSQTFVTKLFIRSMKSNFFFIFFYASLQRKPQYYYDCF